MRYTEQELYAELLGMANYQRESADRWNIDEEEERGWWNLCADFTEFAIGKPELLAEFLAGRGKA